MLTIRNYIGRKCLAPLWIGCLAPFLSCQGGGAGSEDPPPPATPQPTSEDNPLPSSSDAEPETRRPTPLRIEGTLLPTSQILDGASPSFSAHQDGVKVTHENNQLITIDSGGQATPVAPELPTSGVVSGQRWWVHEAMWWAVTQTGPVLQRLVDGRVSQEVVESEGLPDWWPSSDSVLDEQGWVKDSALTVHYVDEGQMLGEVVGTGFFQVLTSDGGWSFYLVPKGSSLWPQNRPVQSMVPLAATAYEGGFGLWRPGTLITVGFGVDGQGQGLGHYRLVTEFEREYAWTNESSFYARLSMNEQRELVFEFCCAAVMEAELIWLVN